MEIDAAAVITGAGASTTFSVYYAASGTRL